MRYRGNRWNEPRRGVFTFIGAVLVAVALLAVLAVPALAVETHAFTGVTIGPEGRASAGQFTDLTSVAVDPSTGDLYVLDTANNGRLYKFDSEGNSVDFENHAAPPEDTNFIEGTGGFNGGPTVENQVAVAPPGAAGGTAGDIYIANGEAVKIYSAKGIPIGQITSTLDDLCGVAVDATGNIFTQISHDNGNPVIRRYTPAANPPTNADESGSSIEVPDTCNLAVDGKGAIYAASRTPELVEGAGGQELWRLQSLTAEAKELFDPNSSTVTVEPDTNEVYVSHGTEVVQRAEDGSVVARFGEGRLVQAPGLSVSGATGDVYVSNRTEKADTSPPVYPGRVDVFGPLVTLPKAVAGAVEDITKNSAILRGTMDADGGSAATCEFQYTPQATYEAEHFESASSVACAPVGPFTGESAVAVSAAVQGLSTGSRYFFRLVGVNAEGRLGSDENGSDPGKVPSFETMPAFNVQTGPVTNLAATSTMLTGSINPEGVSVTECFFEYGKTTAYGSFAPCEAPNAGEIGAGNAPVAVHAAISGLVGSSEYHFRLVGGSSEGGGTRVHGADVAFGTPGSPEILSQSFSGVSQTTATISGSINPHSSSTTYFVEYVDQASFQESAFATATKVPTEGVTTGPVFLGVPVSQTLSGLMPGGRYHFRLYAENAFGHEAGPDEVFTTHVVNPLFGACPANEVFRVEWSATLPDCRAYEQSSPPNKNGDSVAGLYPLMFASEDGSAVTFYSPAGALPPGERGGAQNYSTYLARRDTAAGSWSSQRLLPPEQIGEFAEFLGATPDLRYAVVEAGSLIEETGLFVIDTEDGSVTQIVPYQSSEGRIVQFGFDGASADGSRIFFESEATVETTPRTPAPAAGHDNLYMWERSTGDVSLVGVLPGAKGKEEAPPDGSFGGAYEWYEGEDPSTGGTLNKPTNGFEPLAVAGLHAISPSGEQIFFTSTTTGQLYLRRGLGSADPTTVRISTPNSGVSPSGEYPAAFLEATPDGSHAFFMSREQLTANAASGEIAGERDLYRWEASAPTAQALTDVAPGAEVQGLLGVNSEGSAGYFVARGVLAGKSKLGEAPKPGGENLYRFAEKAAGGFRITFIATLANGSGQSPDRRNVSPKVSMGYLVAKTSRLAENGETLLFASSESLTGYDNFNLEGISCEGGRCPELYLYSAQTGDVNCLSCDPTGEVPLGAASLQDQFFNAYFTPTEPPAVFPSRNLSANGTRVFFQTPDPLVSTDENGNVSCVPFGGQPGKHNLAGPGRCQDVYEWEAVGSGSCQREEANGGCLYLLSTGQSGQPSYFVGASKDGSSAFIATTSKLVPADRDEVDDVYDAREGGGLASQYARPPVPCSSAEACKHSGSTVPSSTSPATSSFQGVGNAKPKQCKKGYVAKKGKCEKKAKKHQKKKAKKHHHKAKRPAGKKRSGGAK